jgi:RNA polymerase sigma-70 factor, ECF subfamily
MTHAEGQPDFAALAEQHRPQLLRCAALLLGDLDEAETVVQEALTRAFADVEKYRPETPFVAWVRGYVVNLCLQHRRRLARHATPTDPATLHPPNPEGQRNGVLSIIMKEELAAKVWLAVGQLPDAYRDAVVLHYIEEMDYAEIETLTGIAAGTLRARALRGRNLLKSELGPVVDTWLRADGAQV